MPHREQLLKCVVLILQEFSEETDKLEDRRVEYDFMGKGQFDLRPAGQVATLYGRQSS